MGPEEMTMVSHSGPDENAPMESIATAMLGLVVPR